ncbi:MAG: 4-hydroxybenzoate octaprenyltransferase [Ignavibacteriae bacterium]|nr:4-hydroxybenzoate octaprenyltransferase [Ignavibacteria bacterium]MBI3365043.1 4-hydroxybenzoate octaprenyltransferase [Ignavibacteriota bacterium]
MKKFFDFVKIEHTLFTLPLIYSGVLLGMQELPSVRLLLFVLVSAVGARTIAFALNRIIDRDIDKRNPRTAMRELPSGNMTLKEALGVLIAGSAIYFGSAALISSFCLMLSPIPLVIFTVYPYMKRFTALAHFGVGLGMSMAPLGGYFAASPSFDNIVPAVLLCLFTVFWGAGFDIIYATLDEDFDRKERLYSFVSRFGRKKALVWSSFFHLVAFACLAFLFFTTIRTWYATPFLLLTGGMLWIEQRKASNVELAFFRINAGLGFVVFAMIVTGAVVR